MSEQAHRNMVKSYADQIIMMITLQLKQLHTRHLVNSSEPKEAVFKLHSMCTTLVVEVTVVVGIIGWLVDYWLSVLLLIRWL